MCEHRRKATKRWSLLTHERCLSCGHVSQRERKDTPTKVLPTLHPLFIGRVDGESLNAAQQAIVRRMKGKISGMGAARITGVNRMTVYKYWRRMANG